MHLPNHLCGIWFSYAKNKNIVLLERVFPSYMTIKYHTLTFHYIVSWTKRAWVVCTMKTKRLETLSTVNRACSFEWLCHLHISLDVNLPNKGPSLVRMRSTRILKPCKHIHKYTCIYVYMCVCDIGFKWFACNSIRKKHWCPRIGVQSFAMIDPSRSPTKLPLSRIHAPHKPWPSNQPLTIDYWGLYLMAEKWSPIAFFSISKQTFPENVDLLNSAIFESSNTNYWLNSTMLSHTWPCVMYLTLQETHVGVSHLWALGGHEQTAHNKHHMIESSWSFIVAWKFQQVQLILLMAEVLHHLGCIKPCK